jgi:Pyruvate/2-oxoglutarate dehydrogenase complex, dehydrogenase (E1) component, eukaryotic type, alpha subunit
VIKENGYASDEDIDAIHKKIKLEIDDAVEFAETSPWPDDNELLKDIYVQDNYPYIME